MELNLKNGETQRLLGRIFCYGALRLSENLTERDVDYILNIIQKHPCFGLIDNTFRIMTQSLGNIEIANININRVAFYDRFYNDIKCPKGIKKILYYLLGIWRGQAEISCPGLLDFRYLYVKKWIDSIAEKSPPKNHC